MGGIAGIVHFGGEPADLSLAARMTAAMPYRGPDGIAHWSHGPAALGHCRLCTTPESLDEHQPLANDDGSVVLVMHGRVDNGPELRRGLLARGARLREGSDAELVLRAYETFGAACAGHIEGDFAFALWDGPSNRVFCARDRSGNRPFFYHWDGKTLAFASESRALHALPWVPRELDEATIAEYLANEWHSTEATFWMGVTRLPAAHQLEVGPSGARVSRYWQPNLHAALPCATDADYVDHYRALFSTIVARMARSHRPVAFEVSGGLDSSAIFAVAERLRRQGGLPAPAIAGYTLDFSGDPDADEMAFARAVGAHLGVRIREIAPTHRPLAWYREWARQSGEFPGYPNGTMALGLREAANADGCRVLVAGEGGDEWLGLGRPGHYYAEELTAGNWRAIFQCARADAGSLGIAGTARWMVRAGAVPVMPEPVKHLARTLRGAWSANARAQASIRHRNWLTPRMRALLDERRASCRKPEARLHHRSQRTQVKALHDAYSALAREAEERSIARQGLELRLPFHDPMIVQFALSTPERLRSLGRTTKRFHRLAMAGLLPGVVLARTTKADFMTTFRRQLDECEAEWSAAAGRRAAWVDTGLVAAMAARRREPDLAGRVEWLLWSLAGCDALL